MHRLTALVVFYRTYFQIMWNARSLTRLGHCENPKKDMHKSTKMLYLCTGEYRNSMTICTVDISHLWPITRSYSAFWVLQKLCRQWLLPDSSAMRYSYPGTLTISNSGVRTHTATQTRFRDYLLQYRKRNPTKYPYSTMRNLTLYQWLAIKSAHILNVTRHCHKF